MTPEQKKKWVDALRSGEYKQGYDSLCTTDRGKTTWCCLGVGLDVLVEGEWIETQCGNAIEWGFVLDPKDNVVLRTGTPSDQQIRIMGITNNQMVVLTGLNDGDKYTFNRIADWIEKYL